MTTETSGVPSHARGYEGFPGRIGRTVSGSERAWPRERRAKDGSPNIVVVLVDDLGYSDVAPFGSEIQTPAISGLAERGYTFTNYHSTPVCSPARAALLTGVNPHRAGFANVANHDPGYPNMRLELGDNVLTLPEILRANGYATFAVGKWHLVRDAMWNDAASKNGWPCQRGFETYYGSLEGSNSFFHPNRIIRDNTPVDPETFPNDFYLTDDLTEEAVRRIKSLRASDSRKPFFLYFAHVAMHGPLGAKPSDLDRFRDRYSDGWDVMQRARLERQKSLGLFPDHLELPPPETHPAVAVAPWESLSRSQRRLYERHQEVYAAMVSNLDQSVGKLVDLLEELDELDNTLIMFLSDNGGTAEGGPDGTRSYNSKFIFASGLVPDDLPEDWDGDVPRDIDLIGGPQAMTHYPRGWGRVSNTPFRMFKGQTYAGGIQVPLIVSWPDGMKKSASDDGVRKQYQYVTDVLPTVLDLLDLDHPGNRNGQPTLSTDGQSFASVLRDKSADSTHPEQYAEFGGHRGFYQNGWKIVTYQEHGADLDSPGWELYNLEDDPNETNNLAGEHPDLVRQMAEDWDRAAWQNTVYPIGGSVPKRVRRPAEREFAKPVRILPGTPKLERYRSSRLTELRSFTIDIEVQHRTADRGVLVSHGDQGGGYSIYVDNRSLYLAYNEYGQMTVRASEPLGSFSRVLARFEALPGLRWRITLEVDGVEVVEIPSILMLVGKAPFGGIEIGANTGGPVHWEISQRYGSFRYTGELQSVTYVPGDRAPYDPGLLFEAERDSALTYD